MNIETELKILRAGQIIAIGVFIISWVGFAVWIAK